MPKHTEHPLSLQAELAGTILEAARVLSSGLAGHTTWSEAWQTIRDLEHKGDAIARDLFEAQTAPGPLPVGAELVQELTG